jgi:hypothetical protein
VIAHGLVDREKVKLCQFIGRIFFSEDPVGHRELQFTFLSVRPFPFPAAHIIRKNSPAQQNFAMGGLLKARSISNANV